MSKFNSHSSFILFILIFCIFATAVSLEVYAASDLLLATSIDATLTETGSVDLSVAPDGYVDYVLANLSWFARTIPGMQVHSLTTTPKSVVDNYLRFRWDQPTTNKLSYSITTDLTLTHRTAIVESKILFPIKNLPVELSQYIQPGEISDLTPKIRRQAQIIAANQDDLYIVVHDLADWVKSNVEYDLSSTNVAASKKASWVLDNKEGVCDELTSLFISLNRALGIPARFVSGVAYTDLDIFDQNWMAHGWAEVYFPNVGWVPFDVTYRELGFLDATHITLHTTPDAADKSVEYLAYGRGIALKSSPLVFDVKTTSVSKPINSPFTVELQTEHDRISLGSYNIVWAKLRNPSRSYTTAHLVLSQTQDLELLSKNSHQSIVLKPKETRTVSWIVRVSPSLSKDYKYTFPLEVRDIRGAVAKTEFQADRSGPFIDFADVDRLVAVTSVNKELFSTTCTAPSGVGYVGEKVSITCQATNPFSVAQSVSVCFEGACESKSFGAYETITSTYNVALDAPSIRTVVFSIPGKKGSTSYATVQTLDAPVIIIKNITMPLKAQFGEELITTFKLAAVSESTPRKVHVNFHHKYLDHSWDLESLSGDQEFVITFYGNNLNAGDNVFTITVTYEDERGREYRTEQEVHLDLKNLSWWQRIVLWGQGVEHRFFR